MDEMWDKGVTGTTEAVGKAKIILNLGIDPKYVMHWGLWEGFREIVQEFRDAIFRQNDLSYSLSTNSNNELQFFNTDKQLLGSVKFDPVNQKLALKVSNVPLLKRQCLLMGGSTKQDEKNLIGRYGEGLKLGILALLRVGVHTRIVNGSEVWEFKLGFNTQFQANNLQVVIHEEKNHLSTCIETVLSGVDVENWQLLCKNFLFFQEDNLNNMLNFRTPEGDILLQASEKGRFYCKGMFVNYEPLLGFGYNFTNLELDRDRQAARSTAQLRTVLKVLWTHVLTFHASSAIHYFDMLRSNTEQCLEFMDRREVINQLSPETIDLFFALFCDSLAENGLRAWPLKAGGPALSTLALHHVGSNIFVIAREVPFHERNSIATALFAKEGFFPASCELPLWEALERSLRFHAEQAVLFLKLQEAWMRKASENRDIRIDQENKEILSAREKYESKRLVLKKEEVTSLGLQNALEAHSTQDVVDAQVVLRLSANLDALSLYTRTLMRCLRDVKCKVPPPPSF